MPSLAGRWGEPTIDGPKVLNIDGRAFHLPQESKVKVVDAGRLRIAWVLIRSPRHVVLLSKLGQLLESDRLAVGRVPDWTTLLPIEPDGLRWPVEKASKTMV